MVDVQQLETGKSLSVIIRLHQFDDYCLLKECLFSLLGCNASSRIQVILVCQNFAGDEQVLRDEIDQEGVSVKYVFVTGQGDLRSLLIKRGFEEVKTKYATILDYDDTTSVYGYTNAIQLLEQNPGLGAVFGKIVQYQASYRDGARQVKRKMQEFYTTNLRTYLMKNPFPIHACVINTEVVRDLPSMVNTKLVACEDHWLFLNVVSGYDCQVLPKDQLMGHYFHYMNEDLNTDVKQFKSNSMLSEIDQLGFNKFPALTDRYPLTRKNRKDWFLGVRRLTKTRVWKDLSGSKKVYFYVGYLVHKLALLLKKKKHR